MRNRQCLSCVSHGLPSGKPIGTLRYIPLTLLTTLVARRGFAPILVLRFRKNHFTLGSDSSWKGEVRVWNTYSMAPDSKERLESELHDAVEQLSELRKSEDLLWANRL
eukprot:1450527-Amphidinium_carterae.1